MARREPATRSNDGVRPAWGQGAHRLFRAVLYSYHEHVQRACLLLRTHDTHRLFRAVLYSYHEHVQVLACCCEHTIRACARITAFCSIFFFPSIDKRKAKPIQVCCRHTVVGLVLLEKIAAPCLKGLHGQHHRKLS